MFELSCEEQQQARDSKPVQSIEDLAANLGMDELVEPTPFVNIHKDLRETFRDWARKVNPEWDGEKIYA